MDLFKFEVSLVYKEKQKEGRKQTDLKHSKDLLVVFLPA